MGQTKTLKVCLLHREEKREAEIEIVSSTMGQTKTLKVCLLHREEDKLRKSEQNLLKLCVD